MSGTNDERVGVEGEVHLVMRHKTKKTKSADQGEVPLSSDQLAALAKDCIPSWIESGKIPKPPVDLLDEVYSPSIPSRGYQFCLVCGKHKKFTSLAGHIQDVHKEFTEKWEIQVLVHTGRGMLERTKKASVDFTRIPEPRTDREWDTYEEIVAQLRNGGVPVYGVLERHVVLRERFMADNPRIQCQQLELMDQAGPSVQEASTSFSSVCICEIQEFSVALYFSNLINLKIPS
ncbi:hypothetical protein OSTOST_21493 [Ostertagia ostertagi]